jgi:pyroglutamyl-peptidase
MTTDLLLSGFEPFDDAEINESWEAVRRAVPLIEDAGITVRSVLLPVEFGRAGDLLDAEIRSTMPRIVIATGLAGGRTAITPERVAVNVQDARIPDNAGATPVDEPCAAGGPVGYFSTLPIKAMTAAISTGTGVPAAVSQTAGTFVCNDVFYRLQYLLATDPAARDAGITGGFIHVPAADVVPAHDSARALTAAGRIALTRRDAAQTDARLPGGSES